MEYQDAKPSVESKYLIHIKIPEACLNGDENCPCIKEKVKKEYNPV